jgi:hypothetical protein
MIMEKNFTVKSGHIVESDKNKEDQHNSLPPIEKCPGRSL